MLENALKFQPPTLVNASHSLSASNHVRKCTYHFLNTSPNSDLTLSLRSQTKISNPLRKISFLSDSKQTRVNTNSKYQPLPIPPKKNSFAKTLAKVSTLISIAVACNYGYAYLVFQSALRKGLGEKKLLVLDSSGNGGSGNSNRNGGGGGGDNNSNSGGSGGGSNELEHKLETNLLGSEAEDEPEIDVFIIIPALNEAACIQTTLRHVSELHPKPKAVVVVDGGSNDNTIEMAEEEGAMVVKSESGRATQMNEGAKRILSSLRGKDGILCFVHADTKIPLDFVNIVRTAFDEDKEMVCGGFMPKVVVNNDDGNGNGNGDVLLFMSLQNISKTWYGPFLYNPIKFVNGLRCLFGDQAMFCKASDFQAVGYFNEKLAIMEDADLCLRLHEMGIRNSKSKSKSKSIFENKSKLTKGKIKMVSRIVETSGRRLKKWGPIKSTYIHLRISFAYAFGFAPDKINLLYKKLYEEIR